jgi:hypothetical protein
VERGVEHPQMRNEGYRAVRTWACSLLEVPVSQASRTLPAPGAAVKIEVHDAMTRELLAKGGARADGIRVYVPEAMV